MLSDRLKRMERHGLVTRAFYSEHPPRAEYTPHRQGQGSAWWSAALAAWGSQHVFKQTRMVHADCGHEVKLGYHCPACAARSRAPA